MNYGEFREVFGEFLTELGHNREVTPQNVEVTQYV